MTETINSLTISGKAKTLADLKERAQSAKVMDLERFYVQDYLTNPAGILYKIKCRFSNRKVIVRSSSTQEDNLDFSNAGHFTSIPDVFCSKNSNELEDAVDKVISSYGLTNPKDEVLIQPMLVDVDFSGVIFTAELSMLSTYYVINYEESGTCHGVTSGMVENSSLKTYIQFKGFTDNSEDSKLQKVIHAARECEKLFNSNALDIEFAVVDDDVYILQVRPISTLGKEDLSDIDLSKLLLKTEKKLQKLASKDHHLLGEHGIFGVMPDWNPAEIIGCRPRKLSLSLYKELVTDSVWSKQRSKYGYRDLHSYPLLISLLGVPFIDVRASFNSFIPSDLNEGIADKLANYYLSKLSNEPFLHDKVEFDIVHSCYYFSLPSRLQELKNHGFNSNELKRIEFSLLNLTNKVISDYGPYQQDIEKINQLNLRHQKILSSNLAIIEKIYWLVEDCKHFGTLPFSGIARAAFIAVQLLKSLVEIDVFSDNEYHEFMNSLNTVSKELKEDSVALKSEELNVDIFLHKYGHLRPGTYDILSLRYDEDFDYYFQEGGGDGEHHVKEFSCSEEKLEKIQTLLDESGLTIRARHLLSFIKNAIEARESSKLTFTRTVSEILRLIEELGRKHDISRKSLSYLDIKTILNMYATLDNADIKNVLELDIANNRDLHKYTRAIQLPSLIINPSDIYQFHVAQGSPNFITQKRVKCEIILESQLRDMSPEGKIVLISSADPGYDFLFSKKISGLVTAYGGANSHMAIRCAELGVPAVIGIGESEFERLSKLQALEIDAGNKSIN